MGFLLGIPNSANLDYRVDLPFQLSILHHIHKVFIKTGLLCRLVFLRNQFPDHRPTTI